MSLSFGGKTVQTIAPPPRVIPRKHLNTVFSLLSQDPFKKLNRVKGELSSVSLCFKEPGRLFHQYTKLLKARVHSILHNLFCSGHGLLTLHCLCCPSAPLAASCHFLILLLFMVIAKSL